MALSPADIAAKWQRNLTASTQSIQAGVQAVTQSPMAKAAAQSAAYVQGVQNAVASGKWQKGLNAVSLSQWQQAVINKGIPRIASGAAAGSAKMQAFMTKWMPYMQQLQAKLATMPRGDFSTNLQRMIEAANFNHAFTG